MSDFFLKQINIPGVSKNRSLSGFSWPEGTLSQLSLEIDQAGSEYRNSPTFSHSWGTVTSSPGCRGRVRPAPGNVALGECGQEGIPARKAGLATDWGDCLLFLAASFGNSPSQRRARSSMQFCRAPALRLFSHCIRVRDVDLATAVA